MEQKTNDLQNCAGFVYHQLGLASEETPVEPGKWSDHSSVFTETDPEHAQAVAIMGSGDNPAIIHFGLVKNHGREMYHRAGTGGPVKTSDMENIRKDYERMGYRFKFLSLKKRE